VAKILLVAQTARAGELNHRFLVPPEWTGSSVELRELFDRTRLAGPGADVLAITRAVTQSSDGGRPGEETLLAAGKPLKRLSEQERAKLRQSLEARTADLERLVTATIDWKKEGRELLVRRPELREWAEALPVAGQPGRLLWKAAAAALTVLLLSLGIGAVAIAFQSNGRTKGTQPAKSPYEVYEKWVKETSKESALETEDELQLALLRRVKGLPLTQDEKKFLDEQVSPGSLATDKKKREQRAHQLVELPCVKAYLMNWKKDRESLETHLALTTEKPDLGSLLPERKATVEEVKEIRDQLAKMVGILAKMRQTIDEKFSTLKAPKEEPAKKYVTLLLVVKEDRQLAHVKESCGEPSGLPSFGPEDGARAKALKRWLSHLLEWFDVAEYKANKASLGQLLDSTAKLWQKRGGEGELRNKLARGRDDMTEGPLEELARNCDREGVRKLLDATLELAPARRKKE
jgi:hypothetical protein